jgi:carbon monoxide dehydrogenase subunit G
MIKTIVVVVVVLIAGVLIFAATKPDKFRVQRAASIKAPPEKIFAFLNDFRRWDAWSPWEKKDPAMKRTFGAATSGKGAVYAWKGNKDVGQGRMEIAESVPPFKITLKLDFVKPFEAHNIVQFTLEPKGNVTNVTWAMQGDTPYFAKIIHVFINMDSMVGKDFETGLANLKAAAENKLLSTT